jgi:hypothetical protein
MLISLWHFSLWGFQFRVLVRFLAITEIPKLRNSVSPKVWSLFRTLTDFFKRRSSSCGSNGSFPRSAAACSQWVVREQHRSLDSAIRIIHVSKFHFSDHVAWSVEYDKMGHGNCWMLTFWLKGSLFRFLTHFWPSRNTETAKLSLTKGLFFFFGLNLTVITSKSHLKLYCVSA